MTRDGEQHPHQRSTSPNTISSEPSTADTSASMMAAAQEIHRLQMRKARRADLAAIGLVGAVGDQIDAELALGRFDGGIDLAGRHVIAFGVELEMVDQRFHRALHLAALGRHDLAIGRGNRAVLSSPSRQFDALLHDPRPTGASLPCGSGSGHSSRRSCRSECRNPSRHSTRRAGSCADPRRRPNRAP